MTAVATPVTEDSKIACAICGSKTHSIQLHLQREHPEMTLSDYKDKFPGHPLLSKLAEQKIAEQAASKSAKETVSADYTTRIDYATEMRPFHELFGLPKTKATVSARGEPIPVTTLKGCDGHEGMIPDLDPNYVFNIDILKTLLMGIELRIPVYLWGHAGTGKTTIYEQIAARTKRPMLRVQHTANMEEEHVIGGWRLRDGHTVFELGPLAMAMKHGWIYMADEYDFGRPEVLSLYQPVLENKALVIKEADLANRIIRPHPAFRFVATGNTNGQGDETGLYQGTTMQNAANYERFGIVERMPYMDEATEALLVSQQANIPMADAKKLISFATAIRSEFDSAKLSNPISPRSLIYAARIGMARSNYLIGLEKAYLNRLSSVDREAARSFGARIFGSTGV
jgi:cobaltochelatase CobS